MCDLCVDTVDPRRVWPPSHVFPISFWSCSLVTTNSTSVTTSDTRGSSATSSWNSSSDRTACCDMVSSFVPPSSLALSLIHLYHVSTVLSFSPSLLCIPHSPSLALCICFLSILPPPLARPPFWCVPGLVAAVLGIVKTDEVLTQFHHLSTESDDRKSLSGPI